MSTQLEKTLRFFLGILLLMLALNAFAGGYYGMAGAEFVPVEWLKGSPFKSYFIPGLFLFVVIGGLGLYSSITTFLKKRNACKIAILTGGITLMWLAIQIAIIGYVSWMQPATTVAGILIILLSKILSNNTHRKTQNIF